MIYTDRELWLMAYRRCEGKHGGKPAKSQICRDYIGLHGEAAFAAMFGCDIDTKIYPDGDPGWDFEFQKPGRDDLGEHVEIHRIDVKTAINPVYLPLPVDSNCTADILVLAKFIEGDGRAHYIGDVMMIKVIDFAKLIGWEWTATVREAGTRQLIPDGPMNHVVLAGELMPMDALRKLLGV
jgi:hypothetical protein